MRFSSLSAGFFRSAALALTLVFATTAGFGPVDAEAAQRGRSHQKKSPPKKKRAPLQQTDSRAFIYINAETGEVLAASAPDKQIEPASLAKEVTAMVVFDALRSGKLSLKQKLPLASAGAAERRGPVLLRTKAGLGIGTRLSVDTLLQATAVASAADATVTLAKGVCDDDGGCFTALMNSKVRQILQVPEGARSSTYFVNSHGMHGNRTTARDLAKIHQYMIKTYPRESRYFGMTSYKVNGRAYPGHNGVLVDYECLNTFGLPYKCLDASKTGFLQVSGYCIVGSAVWNGYHIIGVEMGHKTAAARNRILQEGLDRHFRTLEKNGAPKMTPKPWHFPSILPKPPVEVEPQLAPEPEEDESTVFLFPPPRPPETPSPGS